MTKTTGEKLLAAECAVFYSSFFSSLASSCLDWAAAGGKVGVDVSSYRKFCTFRGYP